MLLCSRVSFSISIHCCLWHFCCLSGIKVYLVDVSIEGPIILPTNRESRNQPSLAGNLEHPVGAVTRTAAGPVNRFILGQQNPGESRTPCLAPASVNVSSGLTDFQRITGAAFNFFCQLFPKELFQNRLLCLFLFFLM